MSRQLPAPIPSNRRPANDGTLYRVRDRDWSHVWGENLTYDQAQKRLDETVSLRKLSRTASIEPMTVQPPDGVHRTVPEVALPDDLSVPGTPDVPEVLPHVPQRLEGTPYEVASVVTTTIPADGVINRIPPGHQLLINGQERQVPTRVVKNDTVECRSLNPAAAAVRSAADDAVGAVIQAKRKVPADVTVKKPASRTAPPPRDVTMASQPATVRLGVPVAAPAKPLPSPLKVATLEDGAALPADAITDDDLPDIAGDLGGGASDADVEHARRQQQAETEGQ